MNYIQQVYKGKNEWWRYVLVLLLFFFGWQVLGVIPLVTVAWSHTNDIVEFSEAAKDSFASLGMNSSLYLFLILFSFVFGFVFLLIGIKTIHKRSIASVITSKPKIDRSRLVYSFFLWMAIGIVFVFIGIVLAPEDYVWNFKLEPFLILLTVSLLFIPIQTTMEELLFRGYLMQGLGGLTKNRWFPLLFTSVVFGLLHGMNPEVQKLGNISMVFYIGTGLFFGIITLMDEGTEIPLGFHAANNIIAAVLVSTDWTVFQTDALYKDISEPSVGWEMFFPVLVVYPLMLIFLSKKYGWSNWKEKLLGPVEKPISLNGE